MINLKAVKVLVLLMFIFSSTQVFAAISMKQAVKKVQENYPGKILKSSTTQIDNQKFYRIRVLNKQGRVITLLVNAKNGRIRKE